MLLPPLLLAPLLIQNSERLAAVLRADDDNDDDTNPAGTGAAPVGAAPTARTRGEMLVSMFVCVCLFALALAARACACVWMRVRVSPIKARRISSTV